MMISNAGKWRSSLRFVRTAGAALACAASLFEGLRGTRRAGILGLFLAGAVGIAQAGPLYLYVSNDSGPGGGVNVYDGHTGAFVDSFVRHASGGLEKASSLTLGPDGNLYVGSVGTNTIKRYSGYSGTYIGDFASGSGLQGPLELTFGPDQNLYVGTHGSGNQIKKFDGATGAFLGDFLSGRTMESPYSVVFGPDGDAYVSMYAASAISRFDGATGAFINDFVAAGAGDLAQPTGLIFAADGSLLVSSANGPVKRYASGTGAYLGNFASDASMTNPGDLGFGPGGDLFVSHGNTDTIKRFDGDTGAYLGNFIVPGSGGLNYNQDFFFSDHDISLVPEPATALMLVGGLALLVAKRRARRVA